MGKYGQTALRAVELVHSGLRKNPVDAWEKASIEIFGDGTSSQKKECPKNAFLGLCEQGMVKGIRGGVYTSSLENKMYAIKAVTILRTMSPDKEISETDLWKKVLSGKEKKYNSQMDVVISLWRQKYII